MKDNVVEEIKTKLDIVDIVGEYVQLQNSGANMRARCPFHNEKSPSFFVSSERQAFKCFGCNKGGDIFTFVMEMDGLDFRGALEMLAQRAGIDLLKQPTTFSKQASQHYRSSQSDTKKTLFNLLASSASFYQAVLTSPKYGKNAQDYLSSRQVNAEMISLFNIGYAPKSYHSLIQALVKKGFSEEDIIDAGLAIKKDFHSKAYDRFRGRIMFPVNDVMGRVVGYSGRILPQFEDNTGKYINVPQSLVYDKSRILFGLDKAKLAIKQHNSVILVEGNLDVVMSHQAGVSNVVGVSGTALTREHLTILKRYTDNLVLSFDGDKAGIEASKKAVIMAYETGFKVKAIRISEGKDAADVVANDSNRWLQASQDTIDFIDYYLQTIQQYSGGKEAEDKDHVIKEVSEFLIIIQNPIIKDHYINKLADFLHIKSGIIYGFLQTYVSQAQGYSSKSIPNSLVEKSPQLKLQEKIIGYALFKLGKRDIMELDEQLFGNKYIGHILQALKLYLSDKEITNYLEFKQSLSQELGQYADNLYFDIEHLAGLNFSQDDSQKAVQDCVRRLKRLYFNQFAQKLREKITKAQEINDKDQVNQLMSQYKAHIAKKSDYS